MGSAVGVGVFVGLGVGVGGSGVGVSVGSGMEVAAWAGGACVSAEVAWLLEGASVVLSPPQAASAKTKRSAVKMMGSCRLFMV